MHAQRNSVKFVAYRKGLTARCEIRIKSNNNNSIKINRWPCYHVACFECYNIITYTRLNYNNRQLTMTMALIIIVMDEVLDVSAT